MLPLDPPPGAHLICQNEGLLAFSRWEWDYAECLLFQEQAQEHVRTHPHFRVEIFCNHPSLFTMGRGNQRDVEGLQALGPDLSSLPYPLHHIYRGGGLTFHGPYQWIHYSIARLDGERYNLSKHLEFMLEHPCQVLESFGLPRPQALRKPLGLWARGRKVASLGIGARRFVTSHGLALNLRHDPIFDRLAAFSPCGLSGDVYSSLEALVGAEQVPTLEELTQRAMEMWPFERGA